MSVNSFFNTSSADLYTVTEPGEYICIAFRSYGDASVVKILRNGTEISQGNNRGCWYQGKLETNDILKVTLNSGSAYPTAFLIVFKIS